MADKNEDAPTPEPKPLVPNHPDPDHADIKAPRMTKRTDAAQAFVRTWLAGRPVPQDAFDDADAVALIDAIDAADPSKK